jgi:hypothetical protein
LTIRVLVLAIPGGYPPRRRDLTLGSLSDRERKSQGMTHNPQTDRELNRSARRLSRSGRPFIGIAIALVGVALVVLGDDQIAALGIAIAAIRCLALIRGPTAPQRWRVMPAPRPG